MTGSARCLSRLSGQQEENFVYQPYLPSTVFSLPRLNPSFFVSPLARASGNFGRKTKSIKLRQNASNTKRGSKSLCFEGWRVDAGWRGEGAEEGVKGGKRETEGERKRRPERRRQWNKDALQRERKMVLAREQAVKKRWDDLGATGGKSEGWKMRRNRGVSAEGKEHDIRKEEKGRRRQKKQEEAVGRARARARVYKEEGDRRLGFEEAIERERRETREKKKTTRLASKMRAREREVKATAR